MFRLLIILFFSPAFASAGLFDSKLIYHSCPTEADAIICSSACQRDSNLSFEIKVNQNQSIVAITHYEGNKLAGQSIYENCKIVDAKNWICTRETPPMISISTEKMVKGVYSSSLTMFHRNAARSITNFYSCAK